MNIILKRLALLLASATAISAHLALPASADSTADLILSLKCPSEYTVNVWRRHGSGELLYRGSGPLGQLSLGKGDKDSTGTAQVYKFKHDDYEYQAIGGTKDHQGRGTLEVSKDSRSILVFPCKET
jgi:hypothetical protein